MSGFPTRVVFVLGLLVLVLLRIGPRHTTQTGFDAPRALADLRQLLGDPPGPRTPGNAAHSATREGIVSRLSALGLEPRIQDTTVCASSRCARVQNISAHVAGPERDRVLLVAHYDSVGAGPGIGDDASGVSILLQAAELAKDRASTNGLALLFTDAEELGLLGARAFVRDHPWMDDLGAVVNLEARGSHGRSWLFETSEPTGWITRLAEREVPRPVMSSLAFEIYKHLPNDTDLTLFKQAGIAGVNFGFIDGVEHYHTPLDDFEHLDPRSVQQQGDQAIALWWALGDAELRDTPEGNDVYADLLGFTVVRWPVKAAVGVALAMLVWVLGLVGASVRGGHAPPRQLAVAAVAVPGFLAVVIGGSVGLHFALEVGGAGYGVEWPFRIGIWALTTVVFVGTLPLWQRLTCATRWSAVWTWVSVGGVASAHYAPGGSYLFVLPAGWAAVFFTAGLLQRRGELWWWALSGSFLGLVFWLELSFELEISLALMAPTVVVPLATACTLLLPASEIGAQPHRLSTALLAVLALLGLGATLVTPVGTSEKPERVSYTHVETPGKAVWMASSVRAPEGFEAGGAPARLPYLGGWVAPAEREGGLAPVGVWNGSTLSVSSRRGATALGISVPNGTDVRLGGRSVQHWGVVSFEGADRFEVELPGIEGVEVFDVLPLERLPADGSRSSGQVRSQWGDRSVLVGPVQGLSLEPL